ncbi:MAG: threonine/serine exporter family protein, partial [Muribaculaceae bacterium]|nr:threonine/serine exporter family protein [Muribaculaceae bacterium]
IPATEMCAFLANYSSALFTAGSTCIRLEKNITRIAEAYGMTVEFTILPRHIHLTVRDCDYHDVVTAITSIGEGPISFEVNTILSKLSWQIADGKIGFTEARETLNRLLKVPHKDLFNLPLIVSCANASFCALFGGDWVAMCVVFVATFVGYVLKIMLAKKSVDYRLTVILCSFVSAVLATGDGLFGLGSTPDIAVATSVLYLVPGIPFINSFSDMLDRHYICAFGRLMNAVVLTFCLSFGWAVAMLMMGVKLF